MELIKQVESILFSAGKRVPLEELAKLCKTNDKEVEKALNSLKKKYDSEDSSLLLIEEGGSWKLTVKEQYLSLVKRIVTETELSKTLMETLAVLAWKAPVLQSQVIKIRTNKAYEHLSELEELGYISRTKHGRTKMLKLANKFFEYFDIPPEKVREKFQRFNDVEKAIQDKEQEAQKLRQEILKKRQEIKKAGEAGKSVDELRVEEDVKKMFGENATLKVPNMPKPDEVPAKKS